MNLVTAAQMKLAEDAANAHGLSYDAMMENAGRATAEAIAEQFGAAGKRVLVLVGPGNNGGDGLVAARYLAELGASVSVYIWKRGNLTADFNWKRLSVFQLPMVFWHEDTGAEQLKSFVENSAIVMDALLGTGVSRPITGDLADLLRIVRQAIERCRTVDPAALTDPVDPPKSDEIGPVIVAVDVPSGLHTDTGALDPLTLPADLTVTFAAPKRGQMLFPGAAYVGQLLIADIELAPDDFPPQLPQLITAEEAADLLPARPIWGHKGLFGKAMVIAGSQNFAGAPALAANAAYRVGAGLVTVATPVSVQPMVAANSIEATFIPLPEADGGIGALAASAVLERLPGYSAALMGPGLGQAVGTAEFLRDILKHLPAVPLVIDADALNLLATEAEWWRLLPANVILTPHPGEMSRLAALSIAEIEAHRLEFVPEMAQKWNAVVVYKGAFSVIANPSGDVAVLPFANPALATAGSGDVLAGCIVGMLAQRLSPFEAAVAGGYLHGLAGEITRDHLWEAGVIAGDLLSRLPLAIKELHGV